MNKKFIYESGGIKMRSKKLKLMVGALLVTMVGATFVGCGSNESAEGDKAGSGAVTISISGSTSVGPLMEKVQEIYEEENSNVTLEIQQNGSGAGIKDVIGGVSEIGMSSRELKDEEKGSIEGTTIAYDGIALLVNPNNTVSKIYIHKHITLFIFCLDDSAVIHKQSIQGTSKCTEKTYELLLESFSSANCFAVIFPASIDVIPDVPNLLINTTIDNAKKAQKHILAILYLGNNKIPIVLVLPFPHTSLLPKVSPIK